MGWILCQLPTAKLPTVFSGHTKLAIIPACKNIFEVIFLASSSPISAEVSAQAHGKRIKY